MITLLLALLFGVLALALLSGDWPTGLLLTVLIGFAQDPIRKLTPGQPGLYVGLVLVAFLASGFVLWQQRRGRFDLPWIVAPAPALRTWLPAFVLLVFAQAANSLLLWGIPSRTLVGMGFYLAPLFGLWMGFQLGLRQALLRRLLLLYLILAGLFTATALLDYWGVELPVFEAVGGGQIIHFRYGFYTTGVIGLWRSTDIAAIHLTFAACLALIFAFETPSNLIRNGWLLLATIFSVVSLLTGRRKAIVQIAVFIGLFLWLLASWGPKRTGTRFLGALLAAASVAAGLFLLDPSELLGDNFHEYIDRASTAQGDILERFNALGIGAFLRGLEISNGIGIGVGTLAQTGAAGIETIQDGSFAYVRESGLGKVAAELGVPGLLLSVPIIASLGQLILANLREVRDLPTSTAVLNLGLLSLALSNLPFFSSAAGVYGDPFVLIISGISFGAVLAVHTLVAQARNHALSTVQMPFASASATVSIPPVGGLKD